MRMPKRHSREEDRISSLPDEILHHIFNFLSATSTVRTTFLSRRWRHVWSSSPNLHFDECNFSRLCTSKTLYNREFMTLVERVLLLSDATNLNCVSISTRLGCDMARVLSWIYTVMKRNVRDLTIYHRQKEQLMLPPKIFHLQSLKRLSITVLPHQILHWPHPQPSASTLAALEDLTLSGFKFVNTARDSISSSCPHLKIWKMKRCTDLYQLDVNCPNLEIFCMDECKGLRDLVVSGPSLMTINIRDTFVHAGKGTISTLEISAPNLCKFIWSDKPVHRYKSSKMFPSCADVRLRSLGGRDLFLSLNETRHLTIDCISLWSCIKDDPLPDSSYRNLEVLQLLVVPSMANVAAAMYKSLRCFPNLKTLDIRSVKQHEKSNMNKGFFKPSKAFKVQDFNKHRLMPLRQLTEVRYKDFIGAPSEVDYLKGILGAAPELKMMTITTSNSNLTHDFSMVAEELQKLPFASPHVKLFFKQPQSLLAATSQRLSIINTD